MADSEEESEPVWNERYIKAPSESWLNKTRPGSARRFKRTGGDAKTYVMGVLASTKKVKEVEEEIPPPMSISNSKCWDSFQIKVKKYFSDHLKVYGQYRHILCKENRGLINEEESVSEQRLMFENHEELLEQFDKLISPTLLASVKAKLHAFHNFISPNTTSVTCLSHMAAMRISELSGSEVVDLTDEGEERTQRSNNSSKCAEGDSDGFDRNNLYALTAQYSPENIARSKAIEARKAKHRALLAAADLHRRRVDAVPRMLGIGPFCDQMRKMLENPAVRRPSHCTPARFLAVLLDYQQAEITAEEFLSRAEDILRDPASLMQLRNMTRPPPPPLPPPLPAAHINQPRSVVRPASPTVTHRVAVPKTPTSVLVDNEESVIPTVLVPQKKQLTSFVRFAPLHHSKSATTPSVLQTAPLEEVEEGGIEKECETSESEDHDSVEEDVKMSSERDVTAPSTPPPQVLAVSPLLSAPIPSTPSLARISDVMSLVPHNSQTTVSAACEKMTTSAANTRHYLVSDEEKEEEEEDMCISEPGEEVRHTVQSTGAPSCVRLTLRRKDRTAVSGAPPMMLAATDEPTSAAPAVPPPATVIPRHEDDRLCAAVSLLAMSLRLRAMPSRTRHHHTVSPSSDCSATTAVTSAPPRSKRKLHVIADATPASPATAAKTPPARGTPITVIAKSRAVGLVTGSDRSDVPHDRSSIEQTGRGQEKESESPSNPLCWSTKRASSVVSAKPKRHDHAPPILIRPTGRKKREVNPSNSGDDESPVARNEFRPAPINNYGRSTRSTALLKNQPTVAATSNNRANGSSGAMVVSPTRTAVADSDCDGSPVATKEGLRRMVKDTFHGYPGDYKVFTSILKDIADCEAYDNAMDDSHRHELEKLFKDYPELLVECVKVFPQLARGEKMSRIR